MHGLINVTNVTDTNKEKIKKTNISISQIVSQCGIY